MVGNTGIQNRSKYLQRVLKEDEKIAGKDEAYRTYLDSLSLLVKMTNDVYTKDSGQLNKKSLEDLKNQYLDVAQKSHEYKVNSKDKTRVTVVDHIFKVISKDLKALNTMDKEHPGKIDDAFEESRAMKVELSESLTTRVGGQMSDRFPVKSYHGKKGFFTARTDTAQDKKWEKIFDAIGKYKLPKKQMEKLNAVKNDHNLRSQLKRVASLYENKPGHPKMRAHFAVAMGLAKDKDSASAMLAQDSKLNDAMGILTTEGLKALMPYNLMSRLSYDPYTRNDNKNSAMYEMAKYLGCERIIAKASPMVVKAGDQVLKGTFMEQANGSDFANLKKNDTLLGYDGMNSPYCKSLYCDLADMQVLDYICGNIDRHKGNMLYQTKKDENGKVKMTGIVGIDNDASFPEDDIKPFEFEHNDEFDLARIYKPAHFRFVTKKTAEMVKNMSRAQLETLLRGHNLSQKAIDKAWERTKEVQKVLNAPIKYNIKYADDLTEDVTRDKYKEDNPFCVLPKYANHPSIFFKFDENINVRVKHARVKNFPEMDRPKYAKADRLTAMVMDRDKISEMNALIKRVNRLKSPSEEFSKMSTAMHALEVCSKAISDKVKDKDFVQEVDFKNYEDCLNALSEATKDYILKKGITQKTTRGRERWQAAVSLENRVEDLIRNFESEKKHDQMQKDEQDLEDNML